MAVKVRNSDGALEEWKDGRPVLDGVTEERSGAPGEGAHGRQRIASAMRANDGDEATPR